MAILTHDKILEEIQKGNIIIEPFSREQVGPASVDLHLGNIFRILKPQKDAFPVTEEAHTESISEVVEIPDGEFFLLHPRETVLGITKEKVTLPQDLCGWLEGRSRFARIGLGVHITSGFIQPGISNHQVLEIANLSPAPLKLFPNTKICQIVLERCEGKAKYQGDFKDQTKP